MKVTVNGSFNISYAPGDKFVVLENQSEWYREEILYEIVGVNTSVVVTETGELKKSNSNYTVKIYGKESSYRKKQEKEFTKWTQYLSEDHINKLLDSNYLLPYFGGSLKDTILNCVGFNGIKTTNSEGT